MARRRIALMVGFVTLGGALIWLGIHFTQVGWDAADKQSSVLGGFSGLGGLMLAIYGIWQTVRQQLPLSMENLTGYLAESVQREWNAEVQIRQLNGTPWISISWQPDMTTQQWVDLLSVIPGALDNPSVSAPDAQALAGETHKIVEVLDKVPGRQLVLLGERGSGKTTLLIRLLLDLLDKRESDAAVPVLLSLSSWIPSQEDLKSWIALEIARSHPVLGISDRRRNARSDNYSRAQALLDQGLVVPLLDGFDELPPGLRVKALEEIDKARLPGLVLVSRTAEYELAVHGARGAKPLAGAPRICLDPVNHSKAAAYLKFGMPSDLWSPVITHLASDGPLARVLKVPLYLFLARSIYTPRGGQEANPRELLDQRRFSNEHDIAAHLFDGYIDSIYEESAGSSNKWTARQARRTLTFLARELQAAGEGGDIKWWQVRTWCNPIVPGLIVGPVAGIGVGLAFGIPAGLGSLKEIGYDPGISEALRAGIPTGALVAFFAAALTGGVITLREDPGTTIRWSPARFAGLVSVGALLGLALESLGVIFQAGILAGLAIFAPSSIARGVATIGPPLETSVGPTTVLEQDRRVFLMIAAIVTLASGLPLFATFLALGDAIGGLYFAILLGLFNGLRVGLKATAWLPFLSVRFYFALRGRAPYNLMTFLADAHSRGILRQVGAVYQFRHIDLQRHLAAAPNS